MSTILARLDDWSDRLPAIVVKEVRQMVRAREFNYSFGFSLLAGLLVGLIAMGETIAASGTTGGQVFSALMFCLGVVGLIVVPLGAFSTLRNERADQTLDLITQTSLSPRNIVVGKLATQWIKLLTLFAGLAPFITMSFLLGGIDLQTILISLGVLFMWSMWVCALCLFLSSATTSRAMSAVVFIGLGFIGLWGLGAGSSLLFMLFSGVGFFPPRMSMAGGTGWFLLGMTAICFTTMANLILLAENRLSLAIEDRSTALRVGFLVQYLVILTCIVGPYVGGTTGYRATEVIGFLIIVGALQLTVTAAFAITEDMVLSRRVFRRVEKSLALPWLAIFRPGGGRGVLWVLTQMLLSLAIGYTVGSPQEIRWLIAMYSYILFFTGVPAAIVRCWFGHGIRTAYVRVSLLLFFPIVGISADLFQWIVAPSRVFDGNFAAWHILNPFRTMTDWPQVEAEGWHVGTFMMGLLGLVSYLILFQLQRREDADAADSH